MPKKKTPESQQDQSARFRAEVERLIAAGELNPTEADEWFDRLLERVAPLKP
jgi:ribosome assembly protein YihI (activator of Der GTPase)